MQAYLSAIATRSPVIIECSSFVRWLESEDDDFSRFLHDVEEEGEDVDNTWMRNYDPSDFSRDEDT